MIFLIIEKMTLSMKRKRLSDNEIDTIQNECIELISDLCLPMAVIPKLKKTFATVYQIGGGDKERLDFILRVHWSILCHKFI